MKLNRKSKMRLCIWQFVCVSILLATIFSQAWAKEPQSQLVVDEFQDALEQISGGPEKIFPVHKAKFIRLIIHKTKDNNPPGIDEFEIFAPTGRDNLALAQRGAIATASSCIAGYAIHKIENLNDGKYGNDHSWIAASSESQWVQIELPQPTLISRVSITRDRTGEFSDRIPEVFEVSVSKDGSKWQSAAKQDKNSADQINKLLIGQLPQRSWNEFLQYAFLRERATWSKIPNDDHLSPQLANRPVSPGGPPYWGRIATLPPLERVLVLFDEMIERLAAQEIDVTAERKQAADLRHQAKENQDSEKLYLAARNAKRQLFFRDPALTPIERIFFTKQHPFLESHNYSEHLDGVLKPGGGVYLLNIPRDQQNRFQPDRARIQQLFDGSKGIVREPVLDFDAKTIYFAYRPDKPLVKGWASYWHIYAMKADGSGLRKLTDGPFHDFDVACLPDGGVTFISTRCKIRFLCWKPQAYVLYRMEADGSNIRRLSHANISEWKPSVMQTGRIMWTRSEYLDKGADFGHTLWSIKPDGTHPELVFGNNTPNCYSQAHEIPGTNELLCTLMSHGDHNGPIALIDRAKEPFDTQAITNITPDTPPQYQMARSHHDTFRDPYPISSNHFLVAHNPDNKHNWGLYVIDRYGNRELLYMDPKISSKHPRPFRTRTRPPVLPSVFNAELAKQGLGQFTVQDVYIGLGSTIARGRAKYLRVSQELPSNLKTLTDGQYCADHPAFTDFYASPVHLVHGPTPSFLTRTSNAPLKSSKTLLDWSKKVSQISPGLYRVKEGGGWPSYVAKASLGTVPIEKDGSANFLAPAGKVLYFQLLDGEYNELQRMRSVIQLQPGERRSCVGCHENRRSSPQPHGGSALLKPPHHLKAPPWGAGAFDYQQVVQPVLKANCVSCHNGQKPKRCDLRGTLDDKRVPISYRTLIQGGWVHYFDFSWGMRHFKAEPLSFGTLQSRLWNVLADKHHKDVELKEPEMRAIKAWIDLNCPLWPNYIFRPDRPGLQKASAQ